ncbi:DMT family transporter [Phytohabitans sp. ZYX-F-186]|uniref:DMT family transporter n=1 Tax=Phytohabitans maris TaxID=3071409 RepID=A0ABU0ZRF4_9ACTN|nr:DMT family transporter [Phytohabitans sp. ZYX-F-186]MDQ7908825.1 DMT family transporter [Phytohabitans sp. ZYX-F-186]
MGAWALAVIFAIASAAAYAAGAVVQERLAADAVRITVLALLRRGRWWFAVALNGAGGALHVAALAFGPLSLVQPLGVLTLVLALPMGAALARRRVSGRAWRGAGYTVAGLVVLLLLISPATGAEALDGRDATALAIAATATVAVLMAAARLSRPLVVRSLLNAVASGVAFAVASALTQTVALRTSETGPTAMFSPIALVLGVMAVGGLLLSQMAYRNSGLGAPLATVTLSNPIASAVIGMVLLGERFVGGTPGALAALAAALLASWGVVVLAQPEPLDPRAPSDPGTTPKRQPALV